MNWGAFFLHLKGGRVDDQAVCAMLDFMHEGTPKDGGPVPKMKTFHSKGDP